MPVQSIHVQRFSIVSKQPFETVLKRLESVIGHPDIQAFSEEVVSSRSFAELKQFIEKSLGSSGFMEFIRFNMSGVIGKEAGEKTPKIMRLVIGNPLIMKEMGKNVHDAASYAPVTVLIDERPGGVHLSYDRMASFLESYGNEDALNVARALDTKVEALLTQAAAI